MDVSPWWLLAGVLTALLGVYVIDRRVSRRRAKMLRRLAENAGYRYSPADRFGLATHVRQVLPGVSGRLAVRDLMYRSDPDGFAYAFTAVVDGGHGGRPERFVVAGKEKPGIARIGDVRHADPALPLGEQYRSLIDETAAGVSDVRPI